MSSQKTVAIAGAGDVAKYVVEQLLQRRHRVVVLSRERRAWFDKPGVEQRTTDYSVERLTAQLADVDVLISTSQAPADDFVSVHFAMIEACLKSGRCRRFIPSEFGGDIERFPNEPGYYATTRAPVRQKLFKLQKEGSQLEFALVNGGWFADYFAPSTIKYLKPVGEFWPIDVEKRTARLAGTGNEKVTFTAVEDFAAALANLVSAEEWEPYIYVAGQTTTWNEAVQAVERFHGINLNVTYRNLEELERIREEHANDADPTIATIADYDILSGLGACEIPADKAERHKAKYFSDIKFRTISDVLEASRSTTHGQ